MTEETNKSQQYCPIIPTNDLSDPLSHHQSQEYNEDCEGD